MKQREGGYLLLLTLIESIVILTVMSGIFQLSFVNYTQARRELIRSNALAVAEAGADNAIFKLNQDNSYAGTNTVCPLGTSGSSPVVLYNDNVKGKATYENCVTAGTIPNEKIVYATGKVYLPASSPTPNFTRKIRLVIEGTQSGSYAVQTGPGGLNMSNSSTITNGPVYVGGALTMINTADIGSAGAPLAVNVADNICPSPADSTFPQLCASGNPISIANTAHIYGAVSANNQSDGSNMSNPGLAATSGVAPPTLPDYDRSAQIAAVATSLSGENASCNGSQSVTWPANVHIVGGDVTIANNCSVTVNGNVWISGNLLLTQKGVIKVAPGVGVAPVIMVDGSTGITLANQSSVSTNSANVGFEFITFWSAAGCSPDCAAVTGVDLFNSQNHQTINIGNQGLAAGTIFYSRWSALTLGNAGTIGMILGQTINLNNSGTISFGSTTGSSIYTWDVRYYEQL